MSTCDISYCATECDQRDCKRNLKYNKPSEKYYSVTTFDDANKNHKKCIWKAKKGGKC